MKLRLNDKQIIELDRLLHMLDKYCDDWHGDREKCEPEIPSYSGYMGDVLLCDQCLKFFKHAVVKRFLCKVEPKPMCHECVIHCYSPKYRQFAREVMQHWVKETSKA